MKRSLLISALFTFCLVFTWAQEVTIPQIGVQAPSFTAKSTNGKISFPSDFGSNWKIIFSHPKDFTPVCSSEILELAYQQKSFEELGAKVIVLSTDILNQHYSWKGALEEIAYKESNPVTIEFPLVDDSNLAISEQYGMIHSKENISQNIRGVYFINPENVIRAIMFYPNEVGRSIDEVKRTLVALQSNYASNETVTPANWQPGDDVVVPVLSKLEKENLGSADSDFYQRSWFMTYKKSK